MFKKYSIVLLLIILTQCLYAQQKIVVYFPFASAGLSQTAKQTLRSVSPQHFNTLLSGHTDTVGGVAYNNSLAAARIKAVAAYLKQLYPGIKFTTHNQGELSPVDHTDSLNRCVVISLEARIGAPAAIVEKTSSGNSATTRLTADPQPLAGTSAPAESIRRLPEKFSNTSGESSSGDNRRPSTTFPAKRPTAMADIKAKADSLQLASIPTEKLDIPNLLFVSDKAILEPSSVYEVERIAKRLLQNFPSHRFEIRGHVNYPTYIIMGPNSAPFKLSVDRAELVRQMLIDNGVPKEKITAMGVGNKELLYPDPKTREEKLKNMRVEVLIYQLNK
ncbi:OmpA family protein [Chitinophaga agri]|uniref:OmpA family protein n=1 Tax=Chitinophaga agri TaxID=2703787 RepID=A0A6B9ZBY2_9BACT|nr:OmpA family protein [Chitinophaga agri]